MTVARAFFGSWEQDGELRGVSRSAGLTLSGWAVDGDLTAAAVRLFIDDELWSTAELGVSRPDVVSYLAGIAEAPGAAQDKCGWTMRLFSVGLDSDRDYQARVEAMTADGRFFDLGVHVLRLTDAQPVKPAPTVDAIRLDLPISGSRLKDETIEVRGWVDLSIESLDSVHIEVDGEYAGTARSFLPRPDVVASKGDPGMCFVGFEYFWPRPAQASRVTITAVALTCSGARITSDLSTIDLAQLPGPEKIPHVGFFADQTEPLEPGADSDRVRVLVATHSLDVGGGQLWLAELMEHLRNENDLELSMLSIDAGPLLEDLHDAGIDVHLTAAPSDGTAEKYECRIQELCSLLRQRRTDVLLCNTLGTFFIADAAQRLGIPVIWAIHEHFELAEWWPWRNKQIQGSHTYTSFIKTLRSADQLVFESQSTRELFAGMLGSDNSSTVYYGIDIDAIDAYAEENPRDSVRRELGIEPETTLMLVMATFEPRKSQPLIIDAFRRVSGRHENLQLMLFGASKTPYTKAVLDLLDLPEYRDVPITTVAVSRDIWRYYHAADLLISGSDIESMPRSFMEAMAFGTPIVTTDVAGCKELVFDAVTGWTTGARTTIGLEMAMERALFSQEEWPAYADAGRAFLQRRHSSSRHGSRIAELLRGAVTAARS
jgi:D-inositol-3-phosphate glycosyltransferase